MDALIGILARRGAAIRATLQDAGFTLSVFLRCWACLIKDGVHRRRFILDQLVICLLSPLPVVAVVGIFTGMILALQVGVELMEYGQAERISDIIGVILFREMGPFMTAMILTASVGSAMAAEVGTMAVSEELDGLQSLSVDPLSFLVMPRLLAITLMAPVLTFIGNMLGIVGGALVGFTQLAIPFPVYTRNVFESLQADGSLGALPEELYTGLLKALVFGALIGSIACAAGLRARGGALGVGRAVRTAVVRSFLMIIIVGYYLSWAFFR